ncbi:MAG: FAD-dependent monooxygenase [Gammaproteobacteria bacterium]|nr:FAD-dependent monooxygenase [Gammaproteobacteria bacterium]
MVILIIGAGPAGLSHAIELSRLGHKVRIIDKALEASPYSKAIVINPRTLHLLEASGATVKLLAEGIKLPSLCMHDSNGKLLVKVQLDLLKDRYPFMLALSQCITERILTEILAGFGVQIERGKEFIGLQQNTHSIVAEINTPLGIESIAAEYLIAADGAHSAVRHTLNVGFSGVAFDDHWNLADLMIDWPAGFSDSNIYMLKEGVVLLIIKIAKGRFRVITNVPNALQYLPKEAKIGEIFWQSDFKVSCRQVSDYRVGRVCLMGDAAHIHSPAGGRGMNLGIEDACVLADLIDKGQVDRYNSMRHPVGKKVIEFTNGLFKTATLQNPWACFLRNIVLKHIVSHKWIQRRLIKKIAGLA